MSRFIEYGEPGLFDEFLGELDAGAHETSFMRVGKVVEWSLFEPELLAAIEKEAKGPGGRPRFHPLLMFKILALQRLHGLADDDTSFQIIDRHSFRAFLGLTAADAVPDGQTIADYREELMKSGSFERLFHLFLGHLQKSHGLGLGREGVMIDATFVEVPKQRNNREQNAMIAEGVIPEELLTHPKKRAHKDTDARWTKKNQISYYGYKDHVKVDVADKLILDGLTTSAEVHDSQPTAELIKEGDKVLWADSAYTGGKIEEDLAAKKVEPQICEKGTRAAALTEEQKQSNHQKSRVRSRVEHVFAQMTGSMRALRQRCIGFERNDALIKLTNLVYNMLRFEQIKRLNISYSLPVVA
jgi:IS5 family transposase